MFEWGKRTYIMGIVNATPDSFSGDGVLDVQTAVSQAMQMVDEGADIIDIGGESTRPSSKTITAAAEIERILPVIRAVRNAVNVPISVDTYRAETAKAALAEGVSWVNDIWGFMADGEMAAVVANAGCPVVLMHNGRNRQRLPSEKDEYYGRFEYNDLITEMKDELQASVHLALEHGINKENIILDPGIGFGKNARQNLVVLRHLKQFKAMGYPLLLGTSRKGFIGQYSGGLPAEERAEGTAATTALGIAQGVDIVRVHDVKITKRVAQMTDAIVRQS